MTALHLFGAADPPPLPDDYRLRVADVATVCDEVRGATLVHADPPWSYRASEVFRGLDGGNAGAVADHYDALTDADIAAHLDRAYDSATASAYLLCWCTWPKLGEWLEASRAMRWRYVTGGAWHKSDRTGIGFHVRGDSEPLLIYCKGAPKPRRAVSNGFTASRAEHSEKPAAWLADLVEAFTDRGDVVLDLYAGRAPMGAACVTTGRRYVGAEIDPARAALGDATIRAALRVCR